MTSHRCRPLVSLRQGAAAVANPLRCGPCGELRHAYSPTVAYYVAMRLVQRLASAIVLFTMLAFAPSWAEASCGLDYCSLPKESATTPRLGTVEVLVRHVEFSLPDGEGTYDESVFRLELHRFARWTLGAWVAPVRLSVAGETHTGIANPVLFLEHRWQAVRAFSLLAGAQLEVPLGDSHNGIASNHSELLAYVGGIYHPGSFDVQVQAGLAAALSEGHSHDGHQALFVNPHADQEALLRVAVTAPLLGGRLHPGVVFNNRSVIENVPERHFATAALVTSYAVTPSVRLRAQVEAPVTSAERMSWRAGLGLGLTL